MLQSHNVCVRENTQKYFISREEVLDSFISKFIYSAQSTGVVEYTDGVSAET